MKARRSGAAISVVAGLACALLACGPNESQRAQQDGGTAHARRGTGDVAPDFDLVDLSGTPVRLADMAGKTVVLDFWATWCLPCEKQVPELNAIYEAHRAEPDFALVGISIDLAEPAVVAEWTAERGVRYPIAIAAEALAYEYGVLGFPATIVVAANGEIFERHTGPLDRAGLEQLLRAAREADPGKPAPGPR